MLRLDPESFSRFFMNQVHGNNRFAGPLFSLLRQAYGTLPGEQARTAVLEFAGGTAIFPPRSILERAC